MVIEKKSIDTLKQQKRSFINFIKNKEKYSKAIGGLFLDQEIEKFDDMEGVRHHLEQKGISKELIDSLNSDYISYLRKQGYYGVKTDYEDGIREAIRKNDKILSKLKKDIVKEYGEHEEFVSLDVKKFVDNEFTVPDSTQIEKFESDSYWRNKIYKKEQEKKSLDNDIESIETEINTEKLKLKQLKWFQSKKKQESEEQIQKKELKKRRKEGQKQDIEKTIKDYEDKENFAIKIRDIENQGESYIFSMMGNGNQYLNIDQCRQAIKNVNKKLEKYLNYIPNEIIVKIKTYIVNIIEKSRREETNKLKSRIGKLVQEYLNYFSYGENKDTYSVRPKTIYSKNRIDPQIMKVINKLGIDINIKEIFEDDVDNDFISDVFIHTTGFSVLDEILEEGGLVSTNEIMKRSRYNQDIMEARTQDHAHHKDVYFSRGFRKNGYGHAKSDDDFVFIANTMSNFAEKGYGVPLSNKMQPNAGLCDVNASHDSHGYSIISESALEKDFWDNNYSKINIQDFYIFVSESKREEIESHPRYKDANIIYIPEKYKGGMTYELYEFMKHEISLREKGQTKRLPIPRKIVTYKDGIKSISDGYKRAFCDLVGDTPEVGFNPLENGDSNTVFDFLETNQEKLGLSTLNVDFQRLKNFLSEQKINIDGFESLLNYPQELSVFTILCTKLGLGDSNKNYSLSLIKNKLKEFGYSMKDLGIFCKTIDWISYILKYKDNLRYDKSLLRGFIDSIRKWCDDWSIDYNQMKDFLIKISNISVRTYRSDFIKEIFK